MRLVDIDVGKKFHGWVIARRWEHDEWYDLGLMKEGDDGFPKEGTVRIYKKDIKK